MFKHSNQISLADIYDECSEVFKSNKPKFLELLSEYVNIADLIPQNFYNHYHSKLGKNREFSLASMISALLLQKILGIQSVTLLRSILILSKELREYCGFNRVPHDSQFTRFKQNFLDDIENMFNLLVDYTEPICRSIDSELASKLIFDTSGIEAYVTENNPKFLNSIIRKLKVAYKDNPNVDIYKMAYGLMPSSASANSEIKQLYINGYFCYVYKFGILTNGLGIVRNISFLDSDFKDKHPELVVDKKSDSPDEDKSISDSKALKPILNDFFNLHPYASYDTFLGDSIFDTYDTYPYLFNECHFKKVLIPLNRRNSNPDLSTIEYNEQGWPLCPRDKSVTLKPVGWTREKGRNDRFKWMCPETHWEGRKIVCHCTNPCTDKTCGRMSYTYPHQDLRMYPGIIRGSDEWDCEYKIRGTVEQRIQYFKGPMQVGSLKTINRQTIKADTYIAGIAQLFTVILADKINRLDCINSLKSLIA